MIRGGAADKALLIGPEDASPGKCRLPSSRCGTSASRCSSLPAPRGLNNSGEFSRRRRGEKFPVLLDKFPDTPELIPCSASCLGTGQMARESLWIRVSVQWGAI